MKPKRLEFCGINSFSEKAVIDFDKLLASGIFGIFGDTGSGKTTILDSMIFALYGRADRVRGGNANELINYNCDKAYVIFDFECEWEKKRRLFRVERQIKRKNSQQELELCEIEGDSVRSVCEGVKKTNEKLLDIIGLSFEDFKKCIALPQGEFAQFVKADKGERLRLISRLFDLEEYGEKLSAVLRTRFEDAKSALDRKDGELSGYAAYTEDELDRQKKEFNDLSARNKELDGQFSKAQAEFQTLKENYLKGKKLADYRAVLAEEEGKKELFSLKRAALKRLPFAAEAEAAEKRMLAADREIAAKTEEQKKLLQKREKDAAALEACEKEIRESDLDNAIAQAMAARAALGVIADDVKEISALKKQRENLAKDYKSAAAEKMSAEKRLKDAEAKIKSVSERSEQGGGADLSEFLRGNFESALLQEEYSSSKQYFSDKLGELHARYERGGALFDEVERELFSRLEHYKKLCGGEKTSDASALLEKYRKEQERQSAAKEEMHRAEMEREKAVSAFSAAESNAARIAEQGALVKEKIDALGEKISRAVGDAAAQDLSAYADTLRRREKSLTERRDLLRKTEESLRKSVTDADVAAARMNAETESLRKERDGARAELDKKLAGGGFTDTRQAYALLAEYPDEQALCLQIDAYDSRLREIAASIRELTGGGEIPPVGEEEFAGAEQAFKQLSEQKDKTGRECAVLKSRIEDFHARLLQKKGLEKERNSLAEKYALIEKLRKLFYGNAFMEFIAGEYLADISRSATETLLKLTNGRYFIRYVQGFFVGDNFNGGELRGVNTLSGGETFLVSLSLALALSSAIYARSLRPIEFFFLDEGFGTLDEKLVDTVMDSLEKLKNTHFSIGLISHVEELKHRIDSKITVLSASENGGSSKIKISY